MIRNSITLLQYAGYLVVPALASVFYNPASGEPGFNQHGLSGLYACGGAALVAAICGFLTGKGKEGAAWAGLILSFILFAYGAHKVFDTLRDLDASARAIVKKREADGFPLSYEAARNSAIYKACVFGFMLLVSLLTFLKLGLSLRGGKPAGA